MITTTSGSCDGNLGFLPQDRNKAHDDVRSVTVQSSRFAIKTNDGVVKKYYK
ncbi:hypothetical protein BGZ52_006157, partial [Haplosporangium bisporale]